MVSSFIVYPDGRTLRDAGDGAIAAALRDPGCRFWVDIEKPTDEDYAILDDVFGFHPLAIEDTIQYVQRPKIESYNHVGDACKQGYFFMVIHGPDLQSFQEQLRTKELDIFVSERYIVTIHEEAMRSITDLVAKARSDARLVLDNGIDMLLHGMLDRLIDNYEAILDYLGQEIDTLEEEAINSPKAEVLTRITHKKRELLDLRRVVGPQREVLALLTRGEVPFIRETTRIYLRDVLDHVVRTVEMVELYRDLIASARDLYLSSINNNLNNIMKTLTIFSVCALPFTILTSFFGMNFSLIPGLHQAWTFWLWVGMMFLASAALFLVFMRRGWLKNG